MIARGLSILRENINSPSGFNVIEKRFMDKVMPEPNTGCWIWTATLDSAGYGRFNVGKGGVDERAHRVSFELYNYPIVDGLHVCHHCDNRYCVNPSHLFLGDDKDNMRDRDQKGRCPKGERHCLSTLKEIDVRIIREAFSMGFKASKIGRYFKISRSYIYHILNRQTWKHI